MNFSTQFIEHQYNLDNGTDLKLFIDQVTKLAQFWMPVLQCMSAFSISSNETIGFIYFPFSFETDLCKYLNEAEFSSPSSPRTNSMVILLGISYACYRLEEKNIYTPLDETHILINNHRAILTGWEEKSELTSPDLQGFGRILAKFVTNRTIPENKGEILKMIERASNINYEYKQLVKQCYDIDSKLTFEHIYSQFKTFQASFSVQKNSNINSYINQLETFQPDVTDYFTTIVPDSEIEALNKTQFEGIIREIWHEMMSFRHATKEDCKDNTNKTTQAAINVQRVLELHPEFAPLVKGIDFKSCTSFERINSTVFRAPQYICSLSDYEYSNNDIIGSGSFG